MRYLLLGLAFFTDSFADDVYCNDTCLSYHARGFGGFNWISIHEPFYEPMSLGVGPVVGGALGYRIVSSEFFTGPYAISLFKRGDLEITYRHNKYQKEGRDDDEGEFGEPKINASAYSICTFANTYVEFQNPSWLTPYLGLGLGYAVNRGSLRIEPDDGNAITIKRIPSQGFAYQGIAGIMTRLDWNAYIGFEYRYVSTVHNLHYHNAGISLIYEL